MTQLMQNHEDSAIQYYTPSRKSQERSVRGDFYNSHSLLIVADPCGAGKAQRRGMIKIVPDDIFLEIFDFYRLWAIKQSQERSWKWRHLAQVCRQWRKVLSLSPRRLDLRILCEYWRPIENVLYSWPTLPVVVGSDAVRPWTPNWDTGMPRNVMVALRHPDRLCEINLNMKSSWTGPIAEMVTKLCRALERIRITVNDATGPSILIRNAFLGGSAPHLREIELDGISFPFPEIRRVLLSTHNLIELHLSKIPHAAYFSPRDLVTGLSTLVQLKSLTVDFHSPASSPPFSTTRRPPQSTTVPSLQSFYFHGTSEYLEDVVSRIHLPALRNITIKLFNQIFFDLPQLSQFIPHLNVLDSTHLTIMHSAELVGIFFFREAEHPSWIFSFQTSCRQLDWQLSFVTQILGHLSPLLSRVVHVTIETNRGIPTGCGREDIDPTQWVELFQSFTHVKEVHVMEAQFVPSVVQALVTEAMATGVLPELSDLYLDDFDRSEFVSDTAEQFVSMRSLSGRPVSLTCGRRRTSLFS